MKKTLALFAAALLLVGAGCAGSQPVAQVPPSNEKTSPVIPPPDNEEKEPTPTPKPSPTPAPAPTPTPTPNPTPAPEPTVKAYTMTEVAAHKDATSCWTVVNGNVYDVTTWISQHPGGSGAILSLCGKDGSATFNAQHGGSAMQENKLATFKIGVVKK